MRQVNDQVGIICYTFHYLVGTKERHAVSSEQTGFTYDNLRRVKKGVELFNKDEYWDCHEELEHWWLEDLHDPARLIYWAIIQVAACLYHYERDNLIGCKGMIVKTWNKLERAEQAYVENELTEKYLDWTHFKKLCRAVPDEPALEDFKPLFDYNFPDPANWELPNE